MFLLILFPSLYKKKTEIPIRNSRTLSDQKSDLIHKKKTKKTKDKLQLLLPFSEPKHHAATCRLFVFIVFIVFIVFLF